MTDSVLQPGQYLLNPPNRNRLSRVPFRKETRAFGTGTARFYVPNVWCCSGRPHPYDTTQTRSHIGHVIDKSMGGTDDPSNLRAICSALRGRVQRDVDTP